MRTTAEEQLSQETTTTTITQISRRKECLRVSVFLFSDTSHLLLYPFRVFFPSRRGVTRSRGSRREKEVKEVHPQEVRVTPAGHGENGVLPTINSLLPLFLTLAE